MTLQNKHHLYTTEPRSSIVSKTIAPKTARRLAQQCLLFCFLSISFSLTSYAQDTDSLQASDIDWVKLEDLSKEKQAKVLNACCGLYIEPAFPTPKGNPENINLSAKNKISAIDDPGNNIVTLEDNVEILHLDQLIQADYGIYNRDTEITDLTGNIRVRQPGMLLIGTDAVINQSTETSQINNASYVLHPESIRGTGEIIVYTDADGIVTIDNGLYTRCEPGDNHWALGGTKITLDQESGRGVARNATLKVKGIPIFYSPYISFPINDERVTGFLAPTFGTTSDGGFDFSAPYYFNLSPNYDATLTPRIMTDRGVLVNLEGRYRGRASSNILTMSFLPSDKLYDEDTVGLANSDSPPVLDRWLVDYDYQGRHGRNWRSSINFSQVSDIDYFQDIDNVGLNSIALSYLTRSAQINYRGDNWNFGTSIINYQFIDPNVSPLNIPYNSLPRTYLTGKFENDLGIEYGTSIQYSFFTRSIDSKFLSQSLIDNGRKVSGHRISIEPAISWPWVTPGAFVKPTVKYKYAGYQLDDQKITNSATPSRGIFMASVDSGLIFEREISWLTDKYTQTLEPRLFYLYSEYEDQNDIPLFDSAPLAFSVSQLFREDRFSGKDRVGDSDQATLALSSKFLDSRGRQKANASIGQIYYFKDRKVTPTGVILPTQLQPKSALVGEVSYQFNNHWKASSYLEWNDQTNHVNVGNFQFRYQSDRKQILNLRYRYRDSVRTLFRGNDRRTIQTDISAIWPLFGNWNLIGRRNYDHANERILERIIGVEYDSCCWNVRLITREWVEPNELLLVGSELENDTGIFLQFELKGLGSVLGGNVSNILSNGISGYREHEYAN